MRELSELIFRLNATTKDYAYISRYLYISKSYIKKILEIIYENNYSGYARCLKKTFV